MNRTTLLTSLTPGSTEFMIFLFLTTIANLHIIYYTGRIIIFKSNQPFHYKINTARCLLKNRILIADCRFHNRIFSDFRNLLSQNGYPSSVINDVLCTYNFKTNVPPDLNIQRKIFFLSLTSVTLVRILCKLGDDFDVTFSSFNESKKILFSQVKDSVPMSKRSNVIYRIP